MDEQVIMDIRTWVEKRYRTGTQAYLRCPICECTWHDNEKERHENWCWVPRLQYYTTKEQTIRAMAVTGAGKIMAERIRQMTDEKYSMSNDQQWGDGELVNAAIAYLLSAASKYWDAGKVENKAQNILLSESAEWWPFKPTTYKPKNRFIDLIHAGALIAAELDRLLARGDE